MKRKDTWSSFRLAMKTTKKENKPATIDELEEMMTNYEWVLEKENDYQRDTNRWNFPNHARNDRRNHYRATKCKTKCVQTHPMRRWTKRTTTARIDIASNISTPDEATKDRGPEHMAVINGITTKSRADEQAEIPETKTHICNNYRRRYTTYRHK